MLETLCAETLVGIHDERLEFEIAARSSLYAGLAQLIDDAPCTLCFKHLEVDRSAPVVFVIGVRLVVAFDIYSELCVVEIFAVGNYGEDGHCHLPRLEYVAMGGRAG